MQDIPVSVKLQGILDKLDALPTLPTIVSKILQLVNNPKSATGDIAKIIQIDQTLTMKVLRIVNSAFYGFPKKISTVSQATVILGYDAIKNMVLSVAVFGMFEGAGSAHFNRTDFWKHSIGVAVIAKMIARKIKFKQLEEAFIAGLVHDIGKVVMDEYLHDEFLQIVSMCSNTERSLYQTEKEFLGLSHSQVGKVLATKWKLPKTLADAIEFHHNPPSDPRTLNLSTFIVAMVHIADIICKGQKIGFSGDNYVPNVEMSLWKVLGLKKNDVIEILQSIDGEMEKAKEFFELLEG